ncbi:zinc uptake transcriptional repressor Zur [Moellerella wisconsensis]|uniref:Zinc uptake transcriptional repressor Zur n=1 Tax=Moellerella wisconsensis TaxID=158849 RepID=A0ACD3Y936_9GAMM|nr:zinc uptake transcriptional repressor Zur [Moellerella wisconsensis]UNH38621.1 zinc uptake transcriptional repressor Zur [Moellerella wisconsensis]
MKDIVGNKLLVMAETICQSRGVRLTPQRATVLRLIAEQPGAISAYDLLDLLREIEPQAKPPTVYRGLEFLLEQGFIHKIESTNSFVICHHLDNPSHISVMLICDGCGSVTESDCSVIEAAIVNLAENANFHICHTVVENHGLCHQCYEKENCAHPEHCGHDHSHQQRQTNIKKKI